MGCELYSVPLTGGTPVKLNGQLVSRGDVQDLQISPDSSRVVYRADQDTDGVVELYSVALIGGSAVKLNGVLVSGGDVGGFQLSPDGSRVVYLADQETDEVFELYESYHAPVDVEIAKSVSPSGPLTPGQSFTYTLTFSNAGPDTATEVVIADIVPTSVISLDVSSGGVTITRTDDITYHWQVQDLTVGAAGAITITGVVSSGLCVDTVFTNTAIIAASTFDTNIHNNRSEVGVTVIVQKMVYLPAVLRD
jgi:uncharacterized repeat protein (TIGR01451 family)